LVPTVTDIHTNEDAEMAQYVDVLQIPAFLVRQTDLVWLQPIQAEW
jgi:2-dehydro-3-deoxyphosphooctonate aldolase (KDO 8-P synthase)